MGYAEEKINTVFLFLWSTCEIVSSICLPLNIKGASGGSKNGDEDEEEVLDEETLRRDQVVKGAIDVLIREYASELNAPSQDPDSQPRNKKRKEKKEEVLFASSQCSDL